MSGLRPVAGKARIEGLDLLRGFALLGIAVVNAQQLFRPEWLANEPLNLAPGETSAASAYFLLDWLFMSKFFTLFTLLFGLGFALQWDKDRAQFSRFYPRRLVFLGALGVFHAFFLYWADVLFLYACAGFILFIFRKISGVGKIQIGMGLLLCLLGWFYGLTAFSGVPLLFYLVCFTLIALVLYFCRNLKAPVYFTVWVLLLSAFISGRAWVTDWQPLEDSEREQKIALADQWSAKTWEAHSERGILAATATPQDIADALKQGDRADFTRLEYEVFSKGSLSQSVQVRKSLFSRLLFLSALYYQWRIVALFFIAAGLMQWGVLKPERRALRKRCAKIGLLLGLPISFMAVLLSEGWLWPGSVMEGFGPLMHELSALLLAMGGGCLVFLWAEQGGAAWVRKLLTSAGRLALSNYIGQSLVMSLLAAGYGLGLYGQLGMWGLIGLGFFVFVALALLSSWWLKWFHMGPLEWLWRCLAYWRIFPFIRNPGHLNQSEP